MRPNDGTVENVRVRDGRTSTDDTVAPHDRRDYIGILVDLRGGSDECVVSNLARPAGKRVFQGKSSQRSKLGSTLRA
jgi:hypothetical protein